MNSKQRCLAAIRGEPVDRVPVFPLLMYLPADRAGISYRQYATNGHALAESQLKVREMFPIDAITSCSDAFRIAADLGGEMVYPETRPPYLARPLIANEQDLRRLKRPDASQPNSRRADRTRATREMVQAVGGECLVLGWVDMPFAEACSACGVTQFLMMLVERPTLAHSILDFLTELVIEFALMQVEAGAPMIGAGDAAASLISAPMYREFALPYEQRVCAAVHGSGGLVKLHICGKTTHLLNDMAQSGADLFNVDHLVDLATARRVYEAAGKAFKGNIDPVAAMDQATPEECERAALDCLRVADGAPYLLSPGCEPPASVTDETMRAFCLAPQTYAAQSHQKGA
ncbi:MAG: hypothetical protein GX552_12465 [Chloroflexi bacterium]|nr:hypothetical protein [Chloroflexota bacterium]